MPIDLSKWNSPASKGDVAGIYLDIALLAKNLRDVVDKLAARTDLDLSEEMAALKKTDDDAFNYFKELSGWDGK